MYVEHLRVFRKCHNIAASLEICFRSPQRSHVHHQCGEGYPKARRRTHMKSKLFANGCFRELLYLSPISPSSSCLTSSACQNGLSLCLLKTSLPPKNTLSIQGMQSSSQLYFQYFLILISFFCRSAQPVFSPPPHLVYFFCHFSPRRAIFYRFFCRAIF